MKHLALILFALSAWGQLVTITGPFRNVDGTAYAGTATIQNFGMTCNGFTVPANVRTITIVAGEPSDTLQLYATTSCNVANPYYSVAYRAATTGARSSAYWQIPANPTSTTVDQIQWQTAPVMSVPFSRVTGITGTPTNQVALFGDGAWRAIAQTHVAGLVAAMAGKQALIGSYTVATLPAHGSSNALVVVTDAATAGSCSVGGGTALSLCRDSGSAWEPVGGSGSGGGGIFTSIFGRTTPALVAVAGDYDTDKVTELTGATNQWFTVPRVLSAIAGIVPHYTAGAGQPGYSAPAGSELWYDTDTDLPYIASGNTLWLQLYRAGQQIAPGDLPLATATVPGTLKRNAGSAGQFVTGFDASGNVLYDTPTGTGNMTNTGTSTTNALPKYTSTSGTAVAPSGVTIDSSDKLSAPGGIESAGGSSGVLTLSGITSGSAKIGVADAAGSPADILLPTATGCATCILQTDGGTPQQTSWVTKPAAESTSVTNTGTGAKVLKDSTNVTARKIKGGTNVTVTENADDITIDAPGGGGTGAFSRDLPVAVCQSAAGSLAWNVASASAPVPDCVIGANGVIYGVAKFSNSSTQAMQYSVELPATVSTVTWDFHWRAAAAGGNVVWQVTYLIVAADGTASDDPALTGSGTTVAAAAVTAATGTMKKSTITISPASAGGKRMYFTVFRDNAHASDTFTDVTYTPELAKVVVTAQ